jgi:thiamine pyrophosphate-dependent acetolactate synthase large subunit-like protein
MTLACKTAIVERDVAHLIFPDNVQTLAAPDATASGPEGRVSVTKMAPDEGVLKEALSLIGKSKRPIVIVGYGARDAMGPIIEMAEQLNAPVLTTFKAKGQIADSHPLAGGVLGRSGTMLASWFMNECDLILALGASFSNHTGITEKRPIIQVDFDRMQLGKFHPVTIPVWGEIGVTAKRLASELSGATHTVDQRPELAERWAIWREEKKSRATDDRGKGVNSASIFAALTKCAPADAVIAVDVGNNTYSFGRYFESQGQRIMMSGYLGSIGFAFCAAMGAWAATQDLDEYRGRKVISISGDGGFGQYMGDFNTAVKYNMDITHILLNNSELGKISKEQRAGEWPVWATDLHNPSFAAFADLCGGKGIKVTSAGELEAAINEALAYDGPALVEIICDAQLV